MLFDTKYLKKWRYATEKMTIPKDKKDGKSYPNNFFTKLQVKI